MSSEARIGDTTLPVPVQQGLVVRAVNAAVDKYVEQKYPRLRAGRASSISRGRDATGREAGRAAGSTVSLGRSKMIA